MSQFLLPDLGEGLEEAQLVQWLVGVGDAVHLNQPICQVETAKALVDIPSPYAGTVRVLHAQPGDTVPVGAPLITIEEAAATATTPAADAEQPPMLVGYGAGGPPQTFSRRRRGAGQDNGTVAADAAPGMSAPAGGRESKASPLVRKIAQERGIDLSTIRGTGPGGRIRVEDLDAASPAPAAAVAEAADDEERISTVGLRKAIAAKMMKSAMTIPHFVEYSLFDATALSALRDRLRSEEGAFAGQRLTFLPFFVRALVGAVRAYPIMNSRWDEEGNAIVIKRSISVGIATDTERGLVVPVIHNAHAMSFAEIAAEIERLVPLARAGKLDARAMTGGTITITNVGAAGPVDTGAPLINAPEACVVGFGAIKLRPTVVGEQVLARPGAWISIACDHRIVDGATAAQFMGALVSALENPDSLIEG
ncbi:MAG TPA: dihydrolipoamide acetyltransferase family protein [Ktedonobacterales bacterium]|nr:dihydrolipoamide acetyltransferase family protein [Ktedonobacterales bacterium]